MHSFVCAACSRPSDSSQIAHVSLQHKSPFTKCRVDSVFNGRWCDGVYYGSLVLHAVVIVALIAEK